MNHLIKVLKQYKKLNTVISIKANNQKLQKYIIRNNKTLLVTKIINVNLNEG